MNRLAEPAAPVRWLRLTALTAERNYDLSEWTDEGSWRFLGQYSGDRLINIGIATRAVSDFGIRAWRLQAQPPMEPDRGHNLPFGVSPISVLPIRIIDQRAIGGLANCRFINGDAQAGPGGSAQATLVG